MGQPIIPKAGTGQQEQEYAVDVVFCLDSTASMDGILAVTKDQIKSIAREVEVGFKDKNKPLRSFRARVIEFRDLVEDGDRQMVEHDWISLLGAADSPETAALEALLANIKAEGGGDDAESALDALCRALDSSWYEPPSGEAVKVRKVVVLFTDNPPRALDASSRKAGEEQMSDTEVVIGRLTAAMKSNELRTAVVGPECPEFQALQSFKYLKHIPLDPGRGAAHIYTAANFQPVYNFIVLSSQAV